MKRNIFKKLADTYVQKIVLENYFEEQTVTEATALQKAVGDISKLPVEDIRFGKYRFAKDAYVYKVPYQKAASNKYISSPTLRNLEQLQSVGLKFDEVIFVWPESHAQVFDPATKQYVFSKVPSSFLTTIVFGTDPNGAKLAYVRKGGQQNPAYVYFEKKKMTAAQVYELNLPGKNIPAFTTKQLLDVMVRGKYVINADGTCDVDGDVYAHEGETVGLRRIEITDLPVKFNNVTGYFNIGLKNYDITKLPNKAKNLSARVPSNLTDLTNFPTKAIDHLGISISSDSNLLNFKGLPDCPMVTLNIMCEGSKVPSLEGCPSTVNRFTIYGTQQNSGLSILHNLNGMPTTCKSLSLFTLKIISFEGLQPISGDLQIGYSKTTNGALLDGDAGNKVKGNITIFSSEIPDIQRSKTDQNLLDKGWYTTLGKQAWDKLKATSKELGIDLDI